MPSIFYSAILTIFSVSSVLLSTAGHAQTDEIPTLVPDPRIVVNGKLDEPVWQHARRITIHFMTQPTDQGISDIGTEARVFDDGQTLYIGFIAPDPQPDKIRAFYRNRDNIWNDDVVGVKIDPYNNKQLAYQFFANPLGSQADSIENAQTGHESASWDGFWQAAGQLTDDGYVVEMAIPFAVMNFPPQAGLKTWALEFVRFMPRDQRVRLSSARISHANKCWVCQMPAYRGFAQATSSTNVIIAPSLVAGRSEQRNVRQHQDWQGENNVELSLDAKWAISPDITLNATLNPDFSQVEADVQQLSVNNPFTLFYAESRPFFTENADYFATPHNLVHTRNISAPNAGAKVTGRTGQHTYGFFAADDDSTTLVLPGNLGSDIAVMDTASKNLAARYSFAYNNMISVGVIGTWREAGDYYNGLSGVDANIRLTAKDTVSLQWLYSQSRNAGQMGLRGEASERYNTDQPFNGQAYRINYQHSERNWRWFGRYDARSKAFRADLGFMPETDWNKFTTGGEYIWHLAADNVINRVRVSGDWDTTHNAAGEFIEDEAEGYAGIFGPRGSYLELGTYQRERVGRRLDNTSLAISGNTERFDEQGLSLFAEVSPAAGMMFFAFWQHGTALDLTNNRLSDQNRIELEGRYSFNRHLELSLRYNQTSMDYQSDRVFTANLTDMRLIYQFSNRSALRLVLLYTDLQRELENYQNMSQQQLNARSRQLNKQLLYSYNLNPQTVFFVGYSDGSLQDDELSRITPSERSAFLKFSYAWQL
ncbi:DUF5916 domain-containing protein [Arsukibacterium sp.]|uniref:DUF5916 domain-containing protein n=1 Tax=Arsukibacterium sp. TaxID=1977258 RepID=UPI00356B41DE